MQNININDLTEQELIDLDNQIKDRLKNIEEKRKEEERIKREEIQRQEAIKRELELNEKKSFVRSDESIFYELKEYIEKLDSYNLDKLTETDRLKYFISKAYAENVLIYALYNEPNTYYLEKTHYFNTFISLRENNNYKLINYCMKELAKLNSVAEEKIINVANGYGKLSEYNVLDFLRLSFEQKIDIIDMIKNASDYNIMFSGEATLSKDENGYLINEAGLEHVYYRKDKNGFWMFKSPGNPNFRVMSQKEFSYSVELDKDLCLQNVSEELKSKIYNYLISYYSKKYPEYYNGGIENDIKKIGIEFVPRLFATLENFNSISPRIKAHLSTACVYEIYSFRKKDLDNEKEMRNLRRFLINLEQVNVPIPLNFEEEKLYNKYIYKDVKNNKLSYIDLNVEKDESLIDKNDVLDFMKYVEEKYKFIVDNKSVNGYVSDELVMSSQSFLKNYLEKSSISYKMKKTCIELILMINIMNGDVGYNSYDEIPTEEYKK